MTHVSASLSELDRAAVAGLQARRAGARHAVQASQTPSLVTRVRCLTRAPPLLPHAMQERARRLCTQLNAMRVERATVAELIDSDQWAELSEIIACIDTEVAAVTAADVDPAVERSRALALRLQDALLACMAIRDLPPQRPSSLRRVHAGGAAAPPCLESGCAIVGCLGNRLVGLRLILPHTKTARSRGVMQLDVPVASATATLLGHHLSWGRALLRDDDDDDAPLCPGLFLTPRGVLYTADAFRARITASLLRYGLSARITHTKVRAPHTHTQAPARPHAAAAPPQPASGLSGAAQAMSRCRCACRHALPMHRRRSWRLLVPPPGCVAHLYTRRGAAPA
jgi:hypothetical protein